MYKTSTLKRIALAAAISNVMLLSAYCLSDMAGAEASQNVSAQSVQGCQVAKRTEEEIREYLKNHPFDLYKSISYAAEPDALADVIGRLSDKTLQDAINALNMVRFIAGLSEVGLDDEYINLTQAASFVNSINDELSHTPSKPSTVSEAVYELGYRGASSSNIAMGYVNPANSIIYGYMNDGNAHNIDRVGHRRWCLNPSMEKTGFGQVGRYSAMYAFDGSFGYTGEYNVAWPAQKMPTEYFGSDQPWSLSTGSFLDADSVKVTLTRRSDSKKWNFSSKRSDGFFNVENSYYGQPGCVIFRPDGIEDFKSGDSFSVVIETGEDTISYDVEFFDLVNYGDVNGDGKVNAVDAKWVLQSVSGSRTLISDQRAAADVNRDGDINAVDAKWILQAASGSREF